MFSFSTSLTPGPNNIMLLSSGLTFGYKKTIPHILGVVIGFPLMTIFVGIGLGEFFKLYPIAFTILKIMGILYLLWLAWKIANHYYYNDFFYNSINICKLLGNGWSCFKKINKK